MTTRLAILEAADAEMAQIDRLVADARADLQRPHRTDEVAQGLRDKIKRLYAQRAEIGRAALERVAS